MRSSRAIRDETSHVPTEKQTQRKQNRAEARRGSPLSPLKTRKLYIRYSYLIRRRFHKKSGEGDRQKENFITYAYRCASAMNAPEIKRQVRNHLKKLLKEVSSSK